MLVDLLVEKRGGRQRNTGGCTPEGHLVIFVMSEARKPTQWRCASVRVTHFERSVLSRCARCSHSIGSKYNRGRFRWRSFSSVQYDDTRVRLDDGPRAGTHEHQVSRVWRRAKLAPEWPRCRRSFFRAQSGDIRSGRAHLHNCLAPFGPFNALDVEVRTK